MPPRLTLVQIRDIGTALLQNKSPGDISRELDITLSQVYRYKKNMEKYNQISAPKGRPAAFDAEMEEVSISCILWCIEKRHFTTEITPYSVRF